MLQNTVQSTIDSTDPGMNMDCVTSIAANEFAIWWFHETNTRGIEFQRALVPKILKHAIWQPVLRSYAQMEAAYDALGNLS